MITFHQPSVSCCVDWSQVMPLEKKKIPKIKNHLFCLKLSLLCPPLSPTCYLNTVSFNMRTGGIYARASYGISIFLLSSFARYPAARAQDPNPKQFHMLRTSRSRSWRVLPGCSLCTLYHQTELFIRELVILTNQDVPK